MFQKNLEIEKRIKRTYTGHLNTCVLVLYYDYYKVLHFVADLCHVV